MKLLLATTWLLMASTTLLTQESEDNLKAYPAPENGMQRFVLHLPEKPNESDFRVELQVGKTLEVDGVNRFFFGGKIEEATVQGWGFSKFQVTELGPMGGTLIGVDPSAPKVKRFITLGGDPFLVRYNSRLPLVVYVPDGTEVRFRVWSASADSQPIDRG